MSAWPQWLRDELQRAKSLAPDEAAEVTTVAFRRFRAELKAAKLCACGEPATHGAHCIDHAARQRFAVDRRRERLQAEGTCDKCGQLPVEGAKKMCEPCLAVARAAHKADYESTKAARLCYRCKAPVEKRRIYCRPCADVDNLKKIEARRSRRAAGLCVKCGGPSPNTSKCEPCLAAERAYRAAMKAKEAEAMRTLIEREVENFTTGITVVDAEYLEARELVFKRGI